jgi:hypothetical protein
MISAELYALISILIAIVFYRAFTITLRKRQGDDPYLANEVYSVMYDQHACITKKYYSQPANIQQVIAHQSLGGEMYDRVVWRFGPKPRRGTKYVNAFDSANWFTPKHLILKH